MPHLSPMSWLMAMVTFWTILMLFTTNIWWTNMHVFSTDSPKNSANGQLSWHWNL